MLGAEAGMDADIASGMPCLLSSSDAQLSLSNRRHENRDVARRPRKLTSSLIHQALVDFGNTNKTATRQTIMDATGLSYGVVDDHIKRRIADGSVRRVVNGVFELVAEMPEDRAVSVTQLPNGTCKLEIGDHCIALTLREMRMVGVATSGSAIQFGR